MISLWATMLCFLPLSRVEEGLYDTEISTRGSSSATLAFVNNFPAPRFLPYH